MNDFSFMKKMSEEDAYLFKKEQFEQFLAESTAI